MDAANQAISTADAGVSSADRAVSEAEKKVEKRRKCIFGRKKRSLWTMIRDAVTKPFRIIERAGCEVVNIATGSIDNAKNA